MVNSVPIALSQTLTLNEDTSLKLTLQGKDEDNDILGFYITKQPKHGTLTLQAKIGDIVSNPVTLNVYWEVNAHRLPPKPDPKINNATLVGIDSNNAIDSKIDTDISK